MIIETKDLRKDYGRHEALNGLSMNVPEGGAYALVGANGAGKTTTIKILLNLIAATSGEAVVLGLPSQRLSPQMLVEIGYVSENQILPKGLTVSAWLDYLRPFYPRWDRALEKDLVAGFNLPAERRIGTLSHGMRIELAMTAALAFHPKVLILDEPFSGVDAVFRDELLDGLLRQAEDTTIFISSHELTGIERIITHVGFLDGGRLLFEQSVDDMNARYREVRVTLECEAKLPPTLLETWLDVSVSGCVVSFVDSAFDEASLPARLSALFGDIRRIDVLPAGLRRVFTAQVRATRKHGG